MTKTKEDNANIDCNHIKCAIEAMLFLSPRSVTINKIAKSFPDLTKDMIKLHINELVNEYNKRNTSIKVVFENNKAEMVIKPEYTNYNTFAIGTKLSQGELKTLALVSLNSPVEQGKITKRRPYNHLAVLRDLDLIEVTKKGHKNILHTTRKFDILFNKKAKM